MTNAEKFYKSFGMYATELWAMPEEMFLKWLNYEQKPSNADRIRAMTDEDLAVMIALPYLASPPWCSEHRTCPYISDDPTPCDKCALDWLRQEAE